MILNKIYIFLVTQLINLIDQGTKRKIVSYFKLKFNEEYINLIDVGAHKGETINLFASNFNINSIFAFEPNPKVFKQLERNKFIKKIENIKLFNFGLGQRKEEKELKAFNDSSSSTFSLINENTEYYKRKKRYLGIFSKDIYSQNYLVNLYPLSDLIKKYNISKIDVLKIDTEGFELNVLKGLNDNELNIIRFVYFEHHYDLMLNKGYTFSDINLFLNKKNFKLKYKVKMNFRKTFEYIYERK